MKQVLGIVAFLFTYFSLFAADGQYDEFEKLYPGCVDNQESTIYGGTFGSWPSNLILPEFPSGGDVELTRFVRNNLTYPEVIESYDSISKEPILAKGVVAVQIVIDRCGRATRQEILQSVNDAYDEEALRIMNGLPVFKPAEMNGIRVKCAMIVPVRFNRSKPLPKEEEIIDFGDDYNFDDW